MQTRNGPHSQSKSYTFGNVLVSLVSEKLCKTLNIKADGVCLGKFGKISAHKVRGTTKSLQATTRRSFYDAAPNISVQPLSANSSKQPPQLPVTR